MTLNGTKEEITSTASAAEVRDLVEALGDAIRERMKTLTPPNQELIGRYNALRRQFERWLA